MFLDRPSSLEAQKVFHSHGKRGSSCTNIAGRNPLFEAANLKNCSCLVGVLVLPFCIADNLSDPNGRMVRFLILGLCAAADLQQHLRMLGLQSHTGIDAAALRTAFLKAALQWHPDRQGPSEEARAAAEEKFKQIHNSYKCLQTSFVC